MANTKDYSMREMVLDRCFSTGKEYTREQLMAIVNSELAQRDMLPIRSRNTFIQDINEMNGKFSNLYGEDASFSKTADVSAITAIAMASSRYTIGNSLLRRSGSCRRCEGCCKVFGV